MRSVLIASILLVSFACQEEAPKSTLAPHELEAQKFIESLIHPTTGLVASRPGECFTTVYKNALAAMVFIHQGNLPAAHRIFDAFDHYRLSLADPFNGFPQSWDPCTGQPADANYWEGDNAFLLLALNYHASKSSVSTQYQALTSELIAWLVQRAQLCDGIIAEGTANMYAALLPHDADPAVATALSQLSACFVNSVAYPSVLDHTVRGALVFNNENGFDYLPNFARTESWVHNNESIDAYSAFSGDDFINVEISAQLLLTAVLRERRMPGLHDQLEKLWLAGPGGSQGLPYFITEVGFDESATKPILDPTAYMLFTHWKFNPWGKP
jgi:hypothetical protein